MKYIVNLYGKQNKTFIHEAEPSEIDEHCDGMLNEVYSDYDYKPVN